MVTVTALMLPEYVVVLVVCGVAAAVWLGMEVVESVVLLVVGRVMAVVWLGKVTAESWLVVISLSWLLN